MGLLLAFFHVTHRCEDKGIPESRDGDGWLRRQMHLILKAGAVQGTDPATKKRLAGDI